MTCEKSVRPVFTVMPPIGKIEEFTAKPLRRVQIDTNQNPLQIIDNARLFRQTRELNRTAVISKPESAAAEILFSVSRRPISTPIDALNCRSTNLCSRTIQTTR